MRNEVSKNHPQVALYNRSKTYGSFLFYFHQGQNSRTHFKSETFELITYFP